jgi:hypothetical protein
MEKQAIWMRHSFSSDERSKIAIPRWFCSAWLRTGIVSGLTPASTIVFSVWAYRNNPRRL